MSKYTTQLRYPIEQCLASKGLEPIEGNWPECWEMLGLSDYPIFVEAHRDVLNTKIVRRYYLREIGFETFGEFAFMLRRTMHEIMPYYNQLYASELLITNPMTDTDVGYSERWDRTEKTGRTAESSGKSSSNSRSVFQDTPMNLLDSDAVSELDYATNVTYDDGTGSTSNETSSLYDGGFSGTSDRTEKGAKTSQSELVLRYRETFLNIDMDIVDKLRNLFMGLW